jgi:hypothetical protein
VEGEKGKKVLKKKEEMIRYERNDFPREIKLPHSEILCGFSGSTQGDTVIVP